MKHFSSAQVSNCIKITHPNTSTLPFPCSRHCIRKTGSKGKEVDNCQYFHTQRLIQERERCTKMEAGMQLHGQIHSTHPKPRSLAGASAGIPDEEEKRGSTGPYPPNISPPLTPTYLFLHA